MRTANITFQIPKTVMENKLAVKEELNSICEYKDQKSVSIDVYYRDSNDKVIGTQSYAITGEKYDLLMSESPDFAVGKLQNEYRESDIWYVIDLIRKEQESILEASQ
ncbi:hypothetical protein [Niallia sp.]|uniref:hypothetical protein n=1 Tax=Niallia sp. TaxID=2837523 RepID=UPI0028A03941|nr:hypothetical protein [Niallia sp.]